MSRFLLCIHTALILSILTSHGIAGGESVSSRAAPYYIYDTSGQLHHWPAQPSSSIQALSVRIKLSIEKLHHPSLPQAKRVRASEPALAPIHKTLRAYLRQSSHFVFETYHIETIPLAWNPTAQTYKLRLSVSQQLSHDGMAQHIGYLDMHGRLKPQTVDRYHQIKHGGSAIYMLMGTTSKVFHIQPYPHSSFKITAGFQEAPSPTKISPLADNVLPITSPPASPPLQMRSQLPQAKFHQNQALAPPAPVQPPDQAAPLLFNLKDYEQE